MTDPINLQQLRELAQEVDASDECIACREYGNTPLYELATGVLALIDVAEAAHAYRASRRFGTYVPVHDPGYHGRHREALAAALTKFAWNDEP